MAKPFKITIDKFFGGIVRDDKSKIIGGALDVEELDIFSNENYMQPELIMSSDTVITNVEFYSRAVGDDDTHYLLGKNTSSGKAVIYSIASASGSAPGAASLLFTSTDTTNLPVIVSDLTFYRSKEASNNTYLLYMKGSGSTWNWYKYNIGAATETSLGAFTNLTGTNMRPTSKVIFGECFVCDGSQINKFDHTGAYTSNAFQLPAEWEAIDIEQVGDAAIIYCRNKAVATPQSKAFWWNLTDTVTFEDAFPVAMGGPQWVKNVKENVILFNAVNGVGKFFKLSFASKGAIPIELPGILLKNIATETSTQPISMAKMVDTKDKILYFGLNKTDKTGIYALGQLDADKSFAVTLSKRYATTDYSLHIPYSLKIQGNNFFGDFSDNGTKTSVRSLGASAARSSNWKYQSIWIDNNAPDTNKQLDRVTVATYPLTAGMSITTAVAVDYSTTYTTIQKPSAANMASGDRLGNMRSGPIVNNNLVYSVQLTGALGVKIVAITLYGSMQESPASQ